VDRIHGKPTIARERGRVALGTGKGARGRSTLEAALFDLQRLAGNRGVTSALRTDIVQRQPAPSRKNDGGKITLDGDEEIPLQSATWSLKSDIVVQDTGQQRRPTIHAATLQAGELTLKRKPDVKSQRALEALGKEYKEGSLRLDRPSRDGAIPATDLRLFDVIVAEYQSGGGDDPTETIRLGVGWIKVSGMAKEAEAGGAKGKAPAGGWELHVAGGEMPPVPLISVSYAQKSAWVEGRQEPRHPDAPGPFTATVRMGAGMALTRIARAQAAGQRLNVAFAMGGRERLQMDAAIVKSIASTSEGPDVVDIEFIAEAAKFVGPSSGGKGDKP